MKKAVGLKDNDLLRQQCYINGRWCDASSGATIIVNNPADGSHLAAVPAMAREEIADAISAADAALPMWRTKTAAERFNVLRKWHDLVVSNSDDLAAIMTAEQGKPLSESKGEIAYAASFIEWFAEEGKRCYGDIIPTHQKGSRLVVLKEPIGVCAAITPWNFPAAMITRKASPALAAGCAMIVKPASQTPLSALALAYLAEQAGIPDGVFNVVTGKSSTIGRELTRNPIVRKLSFTGSTEVGRLLMRQCADTIKKVSFELGGNAPFIVFEDADCNAAVQGALASKYRNSGQTCVCANRIYVQDGIYDQFVGRYVPAVENLKVGDGSEPGIQQGPLIDMDAVAKVESLIADALSKGARLLSGGHRHVLGGTFFQPTVLGDVSSRMDICVKETFGPVSPIIRFRTEAEVLQMANATEYGLASYFYSRDIGRIWRMAEGLEYGMVGVNTGILSTAVAPFGGMKQSGIGREGSRYGIDEYLEIKYVCLSGIDGEDSHP